MTAAILSHPTLGSARSSSERQEQKTIMGWPPPSAARSAAGSAAGGRAGSAAGGEPSAEPPAPLSRRERARRVVTKLASVHAFARGDVVAEHYRLDRRLADGGMGAVWAATDTRTSRDVVIKLMNVELRNDDDAVKRFQQEAQAMTSVKSPHVVEMIDHGVISGTPYLILERLHGEDLAQRLERGPLSLDECAALLDQMASALEAAHAQGIIHRDIKPANIFLSQAGEEYDTPVVFKLLDFGIAKLQNHARIRTAAGVTVGSPHFMSPEQVQGVPDLDGRSDLFALAAVVYTCVTGTMPFHGADLSETFQHILRNEFGQPSEVAGVHQVFDGFFARALALEPHDRWATAGEMAAAFRRAVETSRAVPSAKSTSVAPPAGPARFPRLESVPPARRDSARPAPSDAPRAASDRAPALDVPAFRSFGARTQAALRAHLVAPLARPASGGEVRNKKNLAYTVAAVVSIVVTAGALWQWSHERTAEDRPKASEAPLVETFVEGP